MHCIASGTYCVLTPGDEPRTISELIEKVGAACVTRTRDPRITNAMLYQLS